MRRVPQLVFLGVVLVIGLAYGQTPRFDPASYAQFLTELAKTSPYIQVEQFGRSAAGTPLYLVRVTDPTAQGPKLRLALQAGQHGDEPECTLAAMTWLEALAKDTVYCTELVQQLELLCVPAVNPDGQQRGTRVNSKGVDLNRDWLVCTQPETYALRTLWTNYQPQIFVDLHDLRLDEPRGRAILEGGLLPGHSARLLQLQFQRELTKRLAPLMPTKSVEPSPELEWVLAHRAFAQTLPGLKVSLLFESRNALVDHLQFLELLLDLVTEQKTKLLPAEGQQQAQLQPEPAKTAPEASRASQQSERDSLTDKQIALMGFLLLVAITLVWLLWGNGGPPLVSQMPRRGAGGWR